VEKILPKNLPVILIRKNHHRQNDGVLKNPAKLQRQTGENSPKRSRMQTRSFGSNIRMNFGKIMKHESHEILKANMILR